MPLNQCSITYNINGKPFLLVGMSVITRWQQRTAVGRKVQSVLHYPPFMKKKCNLKTGITCMPLYVIESITKPRNRVPRFDRLPPPPGIISSHFLCRYAPVRRIDICTDSEALGISNSECLEEADLLPLLSQQLTPQCETTKCTNIFTFTALPVVKNVPAVFYVNPTCSHEFRKCLLVALALNSMTVWKATQQQIAASLES